MNEQKYRKRTDKEARERMEARRADKEELRRKLAGRIIWHAHQGTFNEGRNQAKRERRAIRLGSVWVNPRAMAPKPPKPVRPAHRVKLEWKRGMVGINMPRITLAAKFEKTLKHLKRAA